MKKILSIIALLFVITIANAQDKGVEFKLQKNGSFLTEEGKDYEIIQYEGLSAHEIYQKLCTNAGGVYNNPSKVMSNVEDVSIKIRALSTGLVKAKMGMDKGAYYQFQIKIKDGRVRVEAPMIEERLNGATYNDKYIWWHKFPEKWLKDDKSKEKHKIKILWVEIGLNSVINEVLGYSLKKDNKEEDNW